MATFKYYDGTKYNRITGGLVPKTTKTTSDTETYSCNYVNGIVESGSNANGNWIKYNDGTMICTKRIEPSEFGDVQYYNAVNTTWTYPQEFISTDGLTTYVTPRNWSQYMNLAKTSNPTKSTVEIMLTCINLNPLEVITDKAWMYGVNAMAIGKWK